MEMQATSLVPASDRNNRERNRDPRGCPKEKDTSGGPVFPLILDIRFELTEGLLGSASFLPDIGRFETCRLDPAPKLNFGEPKCL